MHPISTRKFQSDARLNVFQPSWANAGDTGSHRSEGDKYNLDVVVQRSQGSEHMVHTNHCHLRGNKTSNSRQDQDVKKHFKVSYWLVIFGFIILQQQRLNFTKTEHSFYTYQSSNILIKRFYEAET